MKTTHICFYKVKTLYGTLSPIQAYKVTFLVYRYVGEAFSIGACLWSLIVTLSYETEGLRYCGSPKCRS